MSAYYNEIDPFAAAWLRELIKSGHIAPGEVDERSITDVRPADLVGFTQVHLFAGIGGWSLAARLAGWPDDRPLWTGSAPCQPFSSAGRRAGTNDERHLWPFMRDLVAVCRPPVVVGEQVASALGLDWLASVRSDLEAEGYAVGAADLCAAGVGAPHLRQRLFWGGVKLADAMYSGRTEGRTESRHGPSAGMCCAYRLADTGGEGVRDSRCGPDAREAGGMPSQGVQRQRVWRDARHDDDGSPARVGDTSGTRLQVPQPSPLVGEGRRDARGAAQQPSGTPRGLADTGEARRAVSGADNDRCSEMEQAGDRQHRSHAPRRGSFIRLDDRGRSRPIDGGWSDADWLFCRDGKWRPVEPGTFPLDHGIPSRVGRLRGYGNAIVPQVAATFLRALVGDP